MGKNNIQNYSFISGVIFRRVAKAARIEDCPKAGCSYTNLWSFLDPDIRWQWLFLMSHSQLHAIVLYWCSLVEGSLGKFVDERKAQLLKDKGLPVHGCAVVAGRTDKGVTALQQVCSFCKLFPVLSSVSAITVPTIY